jgi:hypothetical protein
MAQEVDPAALAALLSGGLVGAAGSIIGTKAKNKAATRNSQQATDFINLQLQDARANQGIFDAQVAKDAALKAERGAAFDTALGVKVGASQKLGGYADKAISRVAQGTGDYSLGNVQGLYGQNVGARTQGLGELLASLGPTKTNFSRSASPAAGVAADRAFTAQRDDSMGQALRNASVAAYGDTFRDTGRSLTNTALDVGGIGSEAASAAKQAQLNVGVADQRTALLDNLVSNNNAYYNPGRTYNPQTIKPNSGQLLLSDGLKGIAGLAARIAGAKAGA